MTDRLAGSTDEGSEQLANCAAYRIGCIEKRLRRLGWEGEGTDRLRSSWLR